MDLLNKLTDFRNINLAYERVRSTQMNRELCAVHEQTLFERCTPKIFTDIHKVLKSPRSFIFQDIEILSKPKKKVEQEWDVRPLARISFYDAVVAQCVVNVIADYIGPLLPTENFGYKLQRSNSIYFYERWQGGYSKFVQQEINALDENSPYKYVIEMDIERFYPNIKHHILLKALKNNIVKPNMKYGNILYEWVENILCIRRIDYSGRILEPDGIPQGTLYSPLFALFYIKDIFKTLKTSGLLARTRYFGYVDDLRFYCEKKTQADKIFEMTKRFLSKELCLNLNNDKSGVIKLDDKKKLEAKIMGKASNLNRAINDDVILAIDGNLKMKTNLINLITEAKSVFDDDNDKFMERLNKFVSYRVTKLITTSDDWNKALDVIDVEDLIKSNFVAMLHVMHLTTNTVRDRQRFVDLLMGIVSDSSIENLSYAKYLAFQYIFKWSPSDLRLDNIKRRKVIELLDVALLYPIYLKATLSRCHNDWFRHIKDYLKNKDLSSQNREMLVTLNLTLGSEYEQPTEYSRKNVNPRLMQRNDMLRYTVFSPFTAEGGYLRDERYKTIRFRIFKQKSARFRTFLRIKVGEGTNSLYEIVATLNQEQRRGILSKIFSWLQLQLNSNEKVPFSVLDPHYIWLDDRGENITLYGNPGYLNELLYFQPPSKNWRSAISNLYKCVFDLSSSLSGDQYLPYGITFWQFRLLALSKARGLSLRRYLELALNILSDQRENNSLPVDLSYIKLSKLYQHYIGDGDLVDRLFQIMRYVEWSWKNGSKDCFFYTLHNHEHAMQLALSIHLLIEESGYLIYLNRKESFRLFAACFLHDIGMLSPPTRQTIYDRTTVGYSNLSSNLSKLPLINLKDILDKTTMKAVLDIHKHVESFYESLVRDRHPYITEQELNADYPKLALTVAERRDIGVISSSHGWNKSKFKDLLTDSLHDGRHPLNLRLLSLLLRISDLCDVTNDRVSRDVLDRNYSRMDDASLFHWTKHLSVERIMIERANTSSAKQADVTITISHRYLPNMHLDEVLIKEKCNEVCKFPSARDAIAELAGDSDVLCRFHCIFLNAAYWFFFEEIQFLNRYFTEKKIPVSVNLKIKLSQKASNDLLIVCNRNEKLWAQEFMRNFFLQ